LNAKTTVPTSGLVTALAACKGINGTSSGPTGTQAAGTKTATGATGTGTATSTPAGKSGAGVLSVGFGVLGGALVFVGALLG
jgi:hypothetical protein